MIQNNNFAKVVAAMALAPFVVDAHMIMASPKPYGAPTKAPLEADGSNFPCQNVAYTGDSNMWAVGSTQTLSWELHDSAIHGGGSCQISVTTDKNPTKNSKWKVIHSIEGGCPYNFNGNLPEDGSVPIPGLPFTVPKDLPNGEMSMAWTWFNRIGNREMYMNCAPITVSGGSSDTTAFNALPDMAIANINVGTGATCKTTETFEYTFENPGSSVSNNMAANPAGGVYQFQPLCGGATTTGPAAGTPPSGNAPPVSPVASAAPPAGTAVTPGNKPTVSAGTPATTLQTVAGTPAQTPVGQKVPPPAPAPGKAQPSPYPVMPSSAPAMPSSAPAAPAPAAPGKAQPSSVPVPPTGTTGNNSCPVDGAVVCQGTTKFAICDRGYANWMDVAAGTTCSNGMIQKRSTHMHRHLRRSL